MLDFKGLRRIFRGPHRGNSSAGRALRSQCRGPGFDPPLLHPTFIEKNRVLLVSGQVVPRFVPRTWPWEGSSGTTWGACHGLDESDRSATG